MISQTIAWFTSAFIMWFIAGVAQLCIMMLVMLYTYKKL